MLENLLTDMTEWIKTYSFLSISMHALFLYQANSSNVRGQLRYLDPRDRLKMVNGIFYDAFKSPEIQTRLVVLSYILS